MNTKLLVLIIEDDPHDRKVINDLLMQAKYVEFDCVNAETLAAAIEILKKQYVNVILLNLDLPDSQGFETFNEINKLNLNIPIIISTSQEEEPAVLAAVRSGAADHFIKNENDGQLLTHIILSSVEHYAVEQDIKRDSIIIENLDEAIYTKEPDGAIKTWNKSAEKIYGYTADEMIGQSISTLYPVESDFNKDMKYIEHAIKSGNHIIQFDTKQVDKNKRIIDVSMTVLFIDYGSKSSSISIIARDITARKFAEQQFAIQYRIGPILNESFSIQETAYALLGTICEIYEWHIGEIWIVDQATNVLRNASTWTDSDYYLEMVNFNKNMEFLLNDGLAGAIWKLGTHYWVPNLNNISISKRQNLFMKLKLRSAFGFPIIFQQKILGVVIFYNLTNKPDAVFASMFQTIGDQFGVFINRKKLETNQNILQQQLLIKNRELEEQAVFLKQANQAKTTFLANMSHELRTPLNSIIGFTEMMYNELTGPINPQHKEYLGEVVTNAKHLLHLINDLLDLTKIEAGKMECHPEPCNLMKVLNEVSQTLSLLIAEKKMRYDTDVDPTLNKDILIDPDKLKQIFYNYLSNAIKFTPVGGKISVHIVPEDKNYFRIDVSDTGIGIKENDIKKLFSMFTQLNISYSKQYQGIGLGLALTRRLVEVMGGRVSVISEPGQGSTFSAVLPMAYSAMPIIKDDATANRAHKF